MNYTNTDDKLQAENNQEPASEKLKTEICSKIQKRTARFQIKKTVEIPTEVADLVKEKRKSLEDEIVNEMNKTHAIVHVNTTHILIEKSPSDFVLDSKQSLLTLYENQPVQELAGKDGKAPSKAQIWLKSLYRRTYKNIVFNPKIAGHYEGNFNIWKGFSVISKKGDCSLFWNHVRSVICAGNEVHYSYIRKWLAHLIQKPWIIATALVLRGKQGTGKGFFVETIGRLLGIHYAPLSSLDRILGRFNSHLKNAILIFADEAVWGGNRKEVGTLKALITEPKLFIEGKGKDGFWIANYKHLIISSNEDWAVHLDPDDRRFFVLDVSDSHKEDIQYFNKLQVQMDAGGIEALMYDLFNEDLSGFDPKIMPENFTGFDMKLASGSSVDRFVYESLKEGCWDHALTGPSKELKNLPISKFYDYYKIWCEREDQKIVTTSQLGKRLKALIAGLHRKRIPTEEDPHRPEMYIFPSLSECRCLFEKSYKQRPQIWE